MPCCARTALRVTPLRHRTRLGRHQARHARHGGLLSHPERELASRPLRQIHQAPLRTGHQEPEPLHQVAGSAVGMDRPNGRVTSLVTGQHGRQMSASSPKYQLLHYARMSAINETTPTHAQSHGSDHLSLVSSFGADNEEQKQFAKFQGRR